MATVSVQFFAPEPELVELLGRWLAGEPVQLAAEQRAPEWKAVPIEDGDLGRVTQVVDDLAGLVASLHPIDYSAAKALDFSRANAGSLFVRAGRRAAAGLSQSTMGAVAQDPADLAVWRRVIGRARRQLHRGAWTRNPRTGEWLEVRGILYSDGALELNHSGVAMVQNTKPFQLGSRPADV